MTTCSFCPNTSVASFTIPIGHIPNDPLQHGTQSDGRKRHIVRFCAECWADQLAWLLQKGLKVG